MILKGLCGLVLRVFTSGYRQFLEGFVCPRKQELIPAVYLWNMLRGFIILSLSILLLPGLRAQEFDFFTKDGFEKYRSHLEFGFGASNFLGDLGGKDGIGTNDFRDLEFTEFNMAGFIGYRHAFFKHLYGRANFAYGRVTGNDKLTKEVFRNNRNLSFRSDIFEFDFMAEFWVQLGGKKGHQYKLKRVGKEESPWRVRGAYFTAFAGLGLFHFNPKAYVQEQWVELRPLRTEGQGLPNGPAEYRLWQLNIPVGVSLMFNMHKHWSMGLELQYRYTFTDYIDDVSTNYYSPDDIALYNEDGLGDLAAYLSNPALGAQSGGVGNYSTSVGQQRGDPRDDDGYLYALLKMDYWFNSASNKKFNKKRTTKRFK